ncbi:MAG TPA: MFS transporter, partial [Thermomicrobiaceae bacterium]|nr:MFS transporter [Thermomicrobiaceae bacterium]
MLHLKRKPVELEPAPAGSNDAEPPSAKQSRLRREFEHTFSALSVHDFRTLWFGMLFTMAAFQISIVARSWLAYDLTGSAVWLGIVAIARGLPQLALAPIGGVAADRFDKRTLLIVTQIAMAILNLIIAVLVEFHWIRIWHLVVLGVIQGSIFPFMMPTRTAYISDLVVDDRLPNALALDSTGRNLNRVVAPTLAGFLIAISPMISFYAVAIFFVCSALTLLILPKPLRKPFRSHGAFKDMASGFKYIAERPTLVMLIGMALLFTLLGMPYSQLLPVFQKSVFHVGA